MPDTNHFTGLPVPLPGEASDGPNDFSVFRAALGGHTVLFASSATNRDSLYSSVPTGTLVVSTTDQTVWAKAASGWKTIFSDTGWVPLASASPGPDITDGGSTYRIINSALYLHINVAYTGDDIAVGSTGNIADIPLFVLPTAAKANYSNIGMGYWSGGSISSIAIYSTGTITATTIMAGSTIASGATLIGTASFAIG